MLVLGVESSCDETSLALVRDGVRIQAQIIASQTEIHARHHGVVPELASRAHVEHIDALARAVLSGRSDPDLVAVTNRPGLSGSLSVGLSFAKAFAWARGIGLVTVDHVLAHAYAVQLATHPARLHAADAAEAHRVSARRRTDPLEYPYLVLLASGGHTLIGIARAPLQLQVLGTTIDDACGEAFDKVGAFLGTGYPGGPAIERLARAGDPAAAALPSPDPGSGNRYDLSYSGLKTAVVHQLDKFWSPGFARTRQNIAAAFQHRALEMLVTRARYASREYAIDRVTAGGGVAANSELRRRLMQLPGVRSAVPPIELCLDNAAMVAGLGYHVYRAHGAAEPSVGVCARVSHLRGR